MALGGAAGEPSGLGGNPITDAGAGGQSFGGGASEPDCRNRRMQRIEVDSDTWIEAADPNARHRADKLLSIVSGEAEHRALFALSVPAAPAGAVLDRATFVLQLASNSDTSAAERRLGLHRLTKEFDEQRASWTEAAKSSAWAAAGGDFGPEWGGAEIAARTTSGDVLIDVTAPLVEIVSDAPTTLYLLALETSSSPPSPAELAFTALDANTAGVPTLLLEFCDL